MEDNEKSLNAGTKWTSNEENQLLYEISQNISDEVIAKLHKRNIGGIVCRRRDIAYKMFKNSTSLEEIILKTKVSEDDLQDIIKKKEVKEKEKIRKRDIVKEVKEKEKISKRDFAKDIDEIKTDISDIKKNIQNILEIIQTFEVYTA
jgi:hypothetical protein